MPQLNPLAFSALGMLIDAPMHPYEMYQLMLARREDRVVKVSAGSLYRAVERLARDGLIVESGTERMGNRPERTVYTVTDAGRDAFDESLEEMLSRSVNEFPEFPLAIGEAHNLPAERVVELLGTRLDAIRDVLTADGRTLAQVEENAGALRYGALAAEQLDGIAAILA